MEIEEYVQVSIRNHLSGIFTAIPALVIESVLEEQRLIVKPSVKQKFKDGTSEEYPAFLNVPLMFPASSTTAFTFPVKKGDTVLLIFSQRGITKFKALDQKDRLVDAEDFRMFDKRDAVAIPGLFPFKTNLNNPKKRKLAHSTTDCVLAHNIGTDQEAEVRIKPNGEIQMTSPVKVKMTAPATEINGNLTVDGTVAATGVVSSDSDVTAGAISLTTHTHGGVTPGGGVTGPAQ